MQSNNVVAFKLKFCLFYLDILQLLFLFSPIIPLSRFSFIASVKYNLFFSFLKGTY